MVLHPYTPLLLARRSPSNGFANSISAAGSATMLAMSVDAVDVCRSVSAIIAADVAGRAPSVPGLV